MRELLGRYGFLGGTFTAAGTADFKVDRKYEVHKQLTKRLPGHVTFTIERDELQFMPATLLGAMERRAAGCGRVVGSGDARRFTTSGDGDR